MEIVNVDQNWDKLFDEAIEYIRGIRAHIAREKGIRYLILDFIKLVIFVFELSLVNNKYKKKIILKNENIIASVCVVQSIKCAKKNNDILIVVAFFIAFIK